MYCIACISREKKTPQYRERNEEQRATFAQDINAYPEEYRIYLDETGICHKSQRTHAYSPKGRPVHGLTYGKRKGRSNIIGAWTSEVKLFATQCFDETINKERFLNWVKEKLCPHLGPGFVVMMDNAPWHKGDDIRELIESTGAKLIKLPPYSPDLNPIEHAWANLRDAIKTNAKMFTGAAQNIKAQLRNMNHFNLA